MATIKSPADIVNDMVAVLAGSLPSLDTSIGSPARKMLDVVAEQIGPAYVASYLDAYVYAVDSKSGADLDDFCGTFGIFRIAAHRAVGKIGFQRPTPSTQDIVIPAGVQVTISQGTVRPIFTTVTPCVLIRGTTLVTVAVQAVKGGSVGNLPAGSLNHLVTGVSGISSVSTQPDATYGGTDVESDDAFRLRFKKTVFRSLAGTEDMFLALSTANADSVGDETSGATAANILGASKRWREQVQVVNVSGTLKAISSMPAGTAKYVYGTNEVFGAAIDNGDILSPNTHYTFDAVASPPEIVSVGTNLVDGGVYELDFEYVPSASRNDPASGITNRVDIWLAGVVPLVASEVTYWEPRPFVATPTTSDLFTGRWKRLDQPLSSDTPANNNKFIQLAWGPIIEFPDSLTIGATVLVKNVDYWVVHRDDAFGYSPRSMFGLEFRSTFSPAAHTQIPLTGNNAYVVNRLPADVQERAERWKLITTDVQAHAAKPVRLLLNFAIMYANAYDRGAVQYGVEKAITSWIDSLSFASVVQVSDLLAIAHNVSGVDNIRFLNADEPAEAADTNSWGIQIVSTDGDHLAHSARGSTPNRPVDLVLSDNQTPILFDIRFVAKAQNTFREAL